MTTIETRIFLESKSVSLALGLAGHMYLVKRQVEVDEDGTILNNFYNPDEDRVVRGSSGASGSGSKLDTFVGLLKDSDDAYSGDTTPYTRYSKDITDELVGPGKKYSDVNTAFDQLGQMALSLKFAAEYIYEVPVPLIAHVANSNAVILSVLNAADVDVRDIETVEGGGRYVDSYYATSHPGGSSVSGTLVAIDGGSRIVASTELSRGIIILGRDAKDDTFIGTVYADQYYGEASVSYSATDDTVSYERAPFDIGLEGGLSVRFKQENLSSIPLVTEPVGVYGVNVDQNGNVDQNTPDYLYGIEKVLLSERDDTVTFTQTTEEFKSNLIVDGAVGYDTLDFSNSSAPALVGSTNSGPNAAELYASYSPAFQVGQWIWNLFVTSGEPTSGGLIQPLGLRFTDFEKVIGSAGNDRLGLWQLNPGGKLSEAQEAAFKAAQELPVSFASGDPATIGAALDARVTAAAQIDQNQQDVMIEGGAGDDIIVGTRTGKDRIYGGDGIDKLYAGGFSSELYGEGGIDYLRGGGLKSQLYGGADADVFGLANHTFVMDATKDDFITWGPFRLTGGVAQWWMEGNWAYWTPFTSLISGAPLPFLNVFGLIAVILDVPAASAFRYTVTTSGQLVVQAGLGRLAQAVVENYELNLDTGEATGHVVAFKQVLGHGSLEDFKKYLNLALKAGFGTGITGTDPLVLDLDGDGLELTRRDSDNVYFNLDNDNFSERTAWVSGDDGFLARDLNGNGTIDNIGELFGDATTPGFTALAALDSNSDGKISASDAAFGTLRIWRDVDGDGLTDPGELKTLAETGIAEISLASHAPTEGAVLGNTIRAEATFTRADGTTSKISDVLLESNQTDSRYLGDTTVSTAAAALPGLKGFGNVTDLNVAMTNDATLLNEVSDFSGLPASTSWATLKLDAEAILMRWAGVDGDAATPMGGGAFDAQKLAFLEKYFGYELTPRDAGGHPSEVNVAELISSWDNVLEKAAVRLAVQGPLHAVFDDLSYDAVNDRFIAASATTLADAYAAAIGLLPSDAPSAAVAWSTSFGPMLAAFGDALVRADGNAVRADYAVQSLVRAIDETASPLSLDQLVASLNLTGVHVGTSGNDSIGRDSATGLQTYVGGAGNDNFTGGAGQDVYVFGREFGQDTIYDSEGGANGDRIRLALLDPEDVTIHRVGNDLVIEIIGTNDKITVQHQYDTPQVMLSGLPMSPNHAIEEIQFADGTIYDPHAIAAAIGLGTNADDLIDGTAFSDEIEGLHGNDLLRGGDGADNYYFSKGDGNDTIHDVVTNPLLKGGDTLFLLGGVAPDDLVFARDGASNDLTVSFTWAGDSILIKDQFVYTSLGFQTTLAPDSRVEAFLFDGGALTWLDIQVLVIENNTTGQDDVTYGFGTSDQFYLSVGDDTLIGFDGGDTYRFGLGAGHDTIEDNSRYPDTPILALTGYTWSADDTIEFGPGITQSDVTFSRTGAAPDLLITINATGETLTVKGQFDGVKLDLFDLLGMGWFDRVEEFQFANGTTLTWEDVLHQVTTGTEGNDTLYGAYYADTMDGKAGDDFLSGGDEGDIYLFGRGYGHDTIQDKQTNVLTPAADTLKFGANISVADVTFTRDGSTNDLLVSIAGDEATLRIVNQYDVFESGPFGAQAFDQIELFRWDDGTVKSFATIHAELIAAARTTGDDLIVGWHFDDTIDGGAGNDRLEGGNGSDNYTFNLGYGQDVISDFSTNILAGDDDRVTFGAGIAPQDIVITRVGASDVRLSVNGTSDSLTIEGQFNYGVFNIRDHEIESFVFANGTTWSPADVRVNYLLQAKTAGNDTIEGFWSDDILDGGAGNDTLRGGDGSDTYHFAAGGGQDVIEENVFLVVYADNDAVEFGAGIMAANTLLARNGNDLIVTFSGSSDQLIVTGQFGHAGWSSGWQDLETFRFADGTIWSDAQVRDKLLQQAMTAGNDTITGFYTADTLDGGGGNDTLRGVGGGDTYLFGRGSGQDVIQESYTSPYEDQPDTVLFNANTARSEVTFQIVGNDLRITIAGTSDTLTIEGHAAGNTQLVEFFQFADGTILSADDVAAGAVQAQATAGNDTITGTNSDNVIDGGAGNDFMSGKRGADTYMFARGYGQDTIDEDGDSSSLSADSLLDKVSFKAGVTLSDLVLTRTGDDLVIAISGTSDQLTIKNQFSATTSFWNPDRIDQFVFADGTVLTGAEVDVRVLQAQATSGNDTLRGYDSQDTLDGLAGNDLLTGYREADTFVFGRGSGQDTIDDNGDFSSISADGIFDVVSFKSDIKPADIQVARAGDDLIVTVTGATDQLTIKNQFASTSSFYNPDRIERFVFADGTTWTGADLDVRILQQKQTAGADTISAYDSADTLDGGAGNDTLSGLRAEDTYIFARGYGSDTIDENGDFSSLSADSIYDRVRFLAGVAPEDVQLARTNNDLVITIAGTTNQLTIKNQFDSISSFYNGDRVERFDFANGTVWTAADIDLRLLQAQATSGNDTMTGYDGNEILDGLGGNDTMTGLIGEDIYLFGRGSGSDTIDDNGNFSSISADSIFDHLQFKSDVGPTDLTFTRSGNDLIIGIFGTSDQIRIKNQFEFTSSFWNPDRIERFDFADGTVWTAADVDQRLLRAEASAGNDTIVAFDGNETLDGFAGNDFLSGRLGQDTYIFGRGYGQDTIDENGNTTGTPVADVVTFKTGLASVDVQLSRSGNDLVIAVAGTSDQLTVKDQFISSLTAENADLVEQFAFANGTVWTPNDIINRAFGGNGSNQATSGNDAIVGTAGADTLDGLAGNDALVGTAGNDTYVIHAGGGNEILDDEGATADFDQIQLVALNPADVTLGRLVNDLIITINATGETVTVLNHFLSNASGIEQLTFADGTTWNRQTIQDQAWLLGTPGADTLIGSSLGNTIDGRGGADLLKGEGGSDIYLYRSGDGNDTVQEQGNSPDVDKLQFIGLNASDIVVGRTGSDLYVTVNATGETIYVVAHFGHVNTGLEQLVFADGTSWDRNAIQANAWFRGTEAGETINGTGAADTIDGRGGDDLLKGGWSNDTYVYRSGDGNDSIQEDGFGSDVDRVNLVDLNPGDITLSRTGHDWDLFINITATGQAIRVINHFNWAGNGIEQLAFANGTVWNAATIEAQTWFIGTNGPDTIDGRGSNDTIDGRGGADTIRGLGGSDTYIYGVGSGNDIVRDSGDGADVDKVKLMGLNAADVELTHVIGTSDLLVKILSSGETLKVQSHFSWTIDGIEQLVFADGTIWDLGAIETQAWYRGTEGADFVNGSGAAETFDGRGGDDTLNGGDGNDTLMGGAGADALNGGNGNDTFIGGLGNDSLFSAAGSDIFIYSSGDGSDFIDEESGSTAETDVLRFTDLNVADITVSRAGNDVLVRINSTGHQIEFDQQFWSGDWYGVDRVEFADGTVWDRGAIAANAWIRGTIGADSLSVSAGVNGNETFFGDLGNDSFFSTAGSDTFVYRSGDGSDFINEESGLTAETDVLRFTDLNAADITVSRVGVDLFVRVNSTSHEIEFDEQFWSSDWYGIDRVEFADGSFWDRATLNYNATHHAPTGTATITGTAAEDQTLTANTSSIQDFDGLGTLHYQWQRSANGGASWSNVGTDQATYVLGDADAGAIVRVTVSYTDGSGTLESLASAATGTVSNINDTPIGVNDTKAVNESAVATGSVLTNDSDADIGDTIRVSNVSNVTSGSQPIGFGGGTNIVGVYGTLSLNSNGSYSYSPNNSAALDLLPGQNVSDVFTYTASDTQNANANATLTFNITGVANTYTGTAGDDTLTGSLGPDILDGLGGNDILIGGAGADTLIGGTGTDTASYANAPAAVIANMTAPASNTGHAAGDTYSGVENLTGSAFNDTLTGDANANTLDGGAGTDTLVGNDGNDILIGGAGGDTLTGGNGTDTASYATAAAGVVANLTTPASNTGDAAGDTYTTIENLTGSAFADTLTGNASANALDGGAGDDILIGGAGADALIGGSGIDTASYATSTAAVTVNLLTPASNTGDAAGDTYNGIENVTGGTAIDNITGDANANTLNGGAGNDTMNGGDGNDLLIGGAGGDLMTGGNGTDTASYATAAAGVTANLATSASNTGDAASDTYTTIENLTGSAFADTLTGTTGVNVLDGGAGDDTLIGAAGADVLIGGLGIDTASYSPSTTAVTANLLTPASNTGDAAGDTYSGIENLTGGTAADNLTGDANANIVSGLAGNDTLNGGDGDDILIGGAGADILNGGNGTDTASYATSTATVIANLTTPASNTGDALGDTYTAIENLTGGTGADTLTGNTGANVLDGGSGNDILIGGAGGDTLIGGAGTDRASYTTATLAVIASLANAAGNTGDAAGDTYSGIENLTGGAGDDTLTGDATANALDGGNGNDLLSGGAGADALTGGAGTDTASYATAAAGVVANLTTPASNTGDAAGDTYTTIENLTGSAFNDTLTGTTGANVLDGGAGGDTLTGGAGADTLIGGAGIDTASYSAATAAVTANLATGAGTAGDASGDTYSGVENLTGGTVADTLTGDNNANVLTGLAGNDNLSGSGGDDTLIGGAGADVLNGGAGIDTASYSTSTAAVTVNLATPASNTGDASGDTFTAIENVTGGSAADNITGDANANTLSGLAGNDTLNGGNGDDILIGGAGADILTGGSGIDTASYATAAAGVTANMTTPAQNTGEAAGDTYNTIENLLGSAFADTLRGDANANRIEGGAGNDTLTGNAGNDTFVFHAGYGLDTISDFAAGAAVGDVIQVDASLFANFADIQSHATQVGANTVITYDAANTITLTAVALTNLNANDFLFV